MAKLKQQSKQSGKSQRPDGAKRSFDLDHYIHKYIWLLIPILIIVYYLYSTNSTGFYQDDEIGHYRNIRAFWSDPFSIMGNQPKPGWKILLVLPGLFGFPGVLVAHCAITALTVVATYYLGRALRIKNSSVIAILLAVQPLFLQLSFRSYSEITAAGVAVLMVLWFAQEKYILAALTSSYLFSIRQEFALVSIGLGILLLMKRKWIPFLLLAWTPVVLGIIGWLHTGNIMWLLDDMRRIGLGVEVPHKPFWHYFETYIFIVGPITLTLFITGYWSFLSPIEKWKENLSRYGFLYFTFTSMFAWGVISAWDALNFGANPGHWRYLLSISPFTAVFTGIGLNAFFDERKSRYSYIALVIVTILVLLFLSKESNGLTLLPTKEFIKFGFVFAIGLCYIFFMTLRVLPAKTFVLALLVLAVVYTFYTEKPRKLDTEALTVKQASAWYSAQREFTTRPLLANHVLLRYFSDIDINDRQRDMSLQKKTLEAAPRGSICVWDSHYGNSQFGGDVPQEYFNDNPRFKFLQQFISSDERFGVLIFEKVQ